MPFYLKESIALPKLAGVRSVLIAPCRFCPAASLAVRDKKPYLELFRRGLKTEAYESFIHALKHRLEGEQITVDIFQSKLVHQFVACMWTSKRRAAFAKRAAEYEAVIVLGCDAMVEAVRESLNSIDCRVIPGMEIEGLMNVLPSIGFPCNITLELQGVASVGTRSTVN